MPAWDDEADPLREIDDRLWRWRRWWFIAQRLPTGGFRCTLGQMVDEAYEVAASSARVRPAKLLGRLPWASMIHGSGLHPDPDCPEEEATDRAVAQLPDRERWLLMFHWLSDLPASEKAKEVGMVDRTYRHHLRSIRWKLKRVLRA